MKECGQGQLKPLPIYLVLESVRVIRSATTEPYTHMLSGYHLDRMSLWHQTNVWFLCNQPGWKFQKGHNALFSLAMLRCVLNLAFLTTATNIQKHPLLLCYCLDFLCPHCPPPTRHSCHVDDSYNLNKQKKGKWKQEGKETSAYSLARLAPLPFAFLRLDKTSN